MHNSLGILLRHDGDRSTLACFLDKDRGKISATLRRPNVPRGALLSYGITSRGRLNLLSSVNIIELPLICSASDLVFFHQVLELLYYFISFENGYPEVFSSLLFFYVSAEKINNSGRRKLFLLKLLVELGFYPHGYHDDELFFDEIKVQPVNAVILRPVDIFLERKIERWLQWCTAMHPCRDCFRAISFCISRES